MTDKSVISPGEIRALIAYYCFPDPAKHDVNQYEFGQLVEKGLIDLDKTPAEISEKGKKYVEMLCETPLPVLKYVRPEGE